GAQAGHGGAFSDGQGLGAFFDQVGQAADEGGVRPWGGHADGGQVVPGGGLQRLGVQVPEDLHVVGEESDRPDHHRVPVAGELVDRVVDVRFQPGLAGRAGPGLVHQLPRGVGGSAAAHDLLGDGAVLRGVGPAFAEFEGGGPGALGIGGGDGVGGEQHLDIACSALVQGGQRLPDAFDEGSDESGVVEELAHLVHLEPLAQAGVLQGVGEVLAVLAAGGVGGVRAGGDGQQPGVAGLVGGVQRVIEVGVPVAVAPVDGKVQSAGGQFLGQGSAQAPVLPIDGADSAEVAVVGGDVLEPFVRDAAP